MRLREVESAFTGKLGATRDDSGDHIYFYLEHEGSEYTVGKLSHSWKRDLNNTQVLLLARKLCLQMRAFEPFVDCGITKEQMIQLWQSRRAGRA